MKAPKIGLDGKKIQALFVQHVEKLVLVLVVVLVGWFVYQGYQLEGLPEGRSPDLLLVKGNETKQFIDDPARWPVVAKDEGRQANMAVVEQVGISQLPNDASKYRPPNNINLPDFPKLSPRVDPKIFAPLHVVVRAIQGPLAAFTDGTEVDPLSQATVEAVAPPPGKARPAPKPKTTRVPKTEGAGPPFKGKSKGGDILDGGGPPPMAGDFYQQAGPGGTAPGAINKESVRGYESAGDSIARDTRAMVVMAVVPYEKQIDEFEKALKNSLDYDENRDFPMYLQFAVERADVTADPAAAVDAAAWVKLNVPAALLETDKWAGFLPEIVDPIYIHDKLTHPAPPFMQRDIWDLLTHPDVPLATYAAAPTTPAGTTPAAATPSDDLPGIELPMPGATGNPGSGNLGGPPRPGMLGGDHTGAGPRQPRTSRNPQTPGPDTSAGPYGSGVPQFEIPKYQLIRFTDTTVERGKQYRYRVKVFLHDPNHPATGYVPPNIVSLDGAVRTRVKDLDAADLKKGNNFRTYWVTSDWSEASPPTILPPSEHFFAGKVTQPAATQIVEGRPKVATSQPQAKALAVIWDKNKVVDVPGEHDVYRGSELNFTKDVKVIHPVTHAVVDLTAFRLRTGALVVDMQGGEKIPPVDRRNENPLESPGEVLIFDAAGKLHVQDESRDVEGYRRYVVPKPEAPRPAATTPEQGFQDILGGESGPPPKRGKGGSG